MVFITSAIVVGAGVRLLAAKDKGKEKSSGGRAPSPNPKDSQERNKRQTQAQLEAINAQQQRNNAYWDSWYRRHPGASNHLDPSPRPLRLLALDGGGVRGIISLIILEKLMKEVAPNAKPCEWFDLIGGTSTGGLIAIMLGRLRMSIPDCIDAYRDLSKEVFDLNALEVLINLSGAHKFSGDKLQEAIEAVVRKYKGSSSTKMWDNPVNRTEQERVCRTFVVAIRGCGVQKEPKLFRTYNNRFQRESADQCQIWEAARATSCAPAFFPEIQVDDVYYADGGMGYNNPARLVLQEARWLWGPEQRIGCVVSIGTGSVDSYMKRFQGPFDLFSLIGIFKNMALDCETTHDAMKNNREVSPCYHRFNPTLTEKIGLDEWKKIDTLKGIAFEYLSVNDAQVTAFATAMLAP